MEFKVKGMTFKNEEGKDIQSLIKKELRELQDNDLIEEKYEGYTNSEIKEMDLNVQEYSDVSFNVKVQEDIFEGKTCVKIYIEKNDGNYIHVGYLPQKLLKQYMQLKEGSNKITGIAELIGGRYKHCRYYEDDYEEKAEIETVNLDYGLLVKLYLRNNNEQNIKTQINQDTKREKSNTYDSSEQNLNYLKTKKDISKEINKQNIITYLIVVIISIPFIWILYKILSFFIWLFN